MIEFELSGRSGLFTDPITRMGGEKCSYAVPTHEALRGVCRAIFWKPTFDWFIDAVRVLSPIVTRSQGVLGRKLDGGTFLGAWTYLVQPRYQVRAHFEWNMQRSDMATDRDTGKHQSQIVRHLEHGGTRDVFIGVRDCQGYVRSCRFGDGLGHFDRRADDQSGVVDLGRMFHSYSYPNQNGTGRLRRYFWNVSMVDGVISFPRAEQCDQEAL